MTFTYSEIYHFHSQVENIINICKELKIENKYTNHSNHTFAKEKNLVA